MLLLHAALTPAQQPAGLRTPGPAQAGLATEESLLRVDTATQAVVMKLSKLKELMGLRRTEAPEVS